MHIHASSTSYVGFCKCQYQKKQQQKTVSIWNKSKKLLCCCQKQQKDDKIQNFEMQISGTLY